MSYKIITDFIIIFIVHNLKTSRNIIFIKNIRIFYFIKFFFKYIIFILNFQFFKI